MPFETTPKGLNLLELLLMPCGRILNEQTDSTSSFVDGIGRAIRHNSRRPKHPPIAPLPWMPAWLPDFPRHSSGYVPYNNRKGTWNVPHRSGGSNPPQCLSASHWSCQYNSCPVPDYKARHNVHGVPSYFQRKRKQPKHFSQRIIKNRLNEKTVVLWSMDDGLFYIIIPFKV